MEIVVGSNVDFDGGFACRLGTQILRCPSDADFRRWECRFLGLRGDYVFRGECEWQGGSTRENLHRRLHGPRENGIQGDENGGVAVVLDLETGYRVHSGCVREPCAVRLTDSDNALDMVVQ